MRTVLITGPGGAGRTTVAAATALRTSREGLETVLLSADGTDAVGAVLGVPVPVGAGPVRVAPRLTVRRPDPAEDFRTALLALQEHASGALGLLGAAPLHAEEITPLPGADALALGLALREAAGSCEVLVVDLPPARDAIALLGLPGELRRYLRRLCPPQRQAAHALRPVLGRLAGVPAPSPRLYETTERWDAELALAEAALEGAGVSVRLVAEPGPAGADAVRLAVLGLALRGLRPDAVVANRLLPETCADPWLAGLSAQQRKTLDDWRQTYPVHPVAHLGHDPRGADDLALLPVPGTEPAGTHAPAHAHAPTSAVDWRVTDDRAQDGVLSWWIPLPGAARNELDLLRRGDDLHLTVGPFHRVVPLPSALRRCRVVGAALRDGVLRVRCEPDPDLWPASGR